MPSEPRKCEGDSDDCTEVATTTRDQSDGWLAPVPLCASCAAVYDLWLANYDGPGDPDGEDICRDYQAEERDRMDAARRLK